MVWICRRVPCPGAHNQPRGNHRLGAHTMLDHVLRNLGGATGRTSAPCWGIWSAPWAQAHLGALVGRLTTVEVPVSEAWRLRDVDTAADLIWAREVHGSGPTRAILNPPNERTIMPAQRVDDRITDPAVGGAAACDHCRLLRITSPLLLGQHTQGHRAVRPGWEKIGQ